ncbi:hypothetical protein LCGC14_2916130 [marine sediment metagenome]|uniref:Uncharacterized protein n=1 Tax=marine sediment metagenome TaxID=412755 RepID=A0A0F8XQG1_9ZZZZ
MKKPIKFRCSNLVAEIINDGINISPEGNVGASDANYLFQWLTSAVIYLKFTYPEFEPLSDYGKLITIDQFRKDIMLGCFDDYDGSGCLATESKQSNVSVSVSSFARIDSNHDFPEWVTHVIWFNK